MRLSKEIVSHIFSEWCKESGEPVLREWIKNNDPMSVFHPIFADFYEGKVNLDDFIQSAIECREFSDELHNAFVKASKDTEATDSDYHYGIALLQRISDVDPANLNDVFISDADLDGEWKLVTAYGNDTEENREALQVKMSEIQLNKASGWVIVDDKVYYRVVETVIVDDEGNEIDSRLFNEASVFEGADYYEISFGEIKTDDIDDALSYVNENNYNRIIDVSLLVGTSAYYIPECQVDRTDVEIELNGCIGEILERIYDAIQ